MSEKEFDNGGPMHPFTMEQEIQVLRGDKVVRTGKKETVSFPGMTLWDYYAGQAMVGLGWDAAMELFSVTGADRREAGEQISMQSADLADAMIAEKRRREQE